MNCSRSARRPSFLSRTTLAAAALALLPAAAFAQHGPRVRVITDGTEIKTFQYGKNDDVVMVASEGAVFEVIHTDGDKYRHQPTNWYWVLLPRDEWGTQRAGWLRGRNVEALPPATPVKPPAPEHNAVIVHSPAPPPAPAPAVEPPVIVPAEPPAAPAPLEVVLRFEFAKSHLTDEAKATLAEAMASVKGRTTEVAFSLAGHADAVGSEKYNDKLGLARAETVKRFLVEQYDIAVEQISVVSHGEAQPAASNHSAEGRAQNRRVVVQASPKSYGR